MVRFNSSRHRMSYCRIGEGSDVYLIRSGSILVCHCARGGFTCQVGEEQKMIDHLVRHRRAGDLVPDRAIRRLSAERDGIPYKTDVQRAMESYAFDTLQLDMIGVERPEDLLDRGDESL